jgi:hypothetical protein
MSFVRGRGRKSRQPGEQCVGDGTALPTAAQLSPTYSGWNHCIRRLWSFSPGSTVWQWPRRQWSRREVLLPPLLGGSPKAAREPGAALRGWLLGLVAVCPEKANAGGLGHGSRGNLASMQDLHNFQVSCFSGLMQRAWVMAARLLRWQDRDQPTRAPLLAGVVPITQ